MLVPELQTLWRGCRQACRSLLIGTLILGQGVFLTAAQPSPNIEPFTSAADAGLRQMIQRDWIEQDRAATSSDSFQVLAIAVINQLGPNGAKFTARNTKLLADGVAESDRRWRELYLDACHDRRVARLTPHLDELRRIVFTKHHDIGGQHYAYTEDISDSPYNDNNPFPASGQLCLLEMDGVYGRVRTLLEEPHGLIRDPAVSYDGERILFAWRKSMVDDDYHLYEMSVADEQIRQLTFGRGVADYEPTYLPNGDIMFNSSRCQQIVDCWWADVSNLYTCDGVPGHVQRPGEQAGTRAGGSTVRDLLCHHRRSA